MRSLKWYFFLVFLSCSAFVLYVYSVAGTLENPNNPNDTSGVPAAYVFLAIIMGLGSLSLVLSLIGFLVCNLWKVEHFKIKFFISSIANFPLLVTCAIGIFSVAAFSYDSIIGILSGMLFFMVAIFLCLGFIRAAKSSRSSI